MTDLYPLHEVSPQSFIYAVDDAISTEDCAGMIKKFEASPDQQYSTAVDSCRLETIHREYWKI